MSSSPFVIALIDDDPFVTEGWKIVLSETRIHTYDSPKSFFADLSPAFLNCLSAVITDLHFEHDMQPGGYLIAETMRRMRPDLPLILISNELNPNLYAFDGTLSKDPCSPHELLETIEKINARKGRIGCPK